MIRTPISPLLLTTVLALPMLQSKIAIASQASFEGVEIPFIHHRRGKITKVNVQVFCAIPTSIVERLKSGFRTKSCSETLHPVTHSTKEGWDSIWARDSNGRLNLSFETSHAGKVSLPPIKFGYKNRIGGKGATVCLRLSFSANDLFYPNNKFSFCNRKSALNFSDYSDFLSRGLNLDEQRGW